MIFGLAGLALFGLERLAPAHAEGTPPIVIDAAFVEGLRTDATRRTGHAPDPAQTDALVDGWVREEALYREARAMGLDEGDLVVRRRLVQKIELLIAAEVAPEEPNDAAIAAYLAAHEDAFRTPARTSLSICFVSRELHDTPAQVMEEHLAALRAGSESPCDPHLSGQQFRGRTDRQLRAALGDEVTDAIGTAAEGAWVGPIEAPRGLYAVRVSEREPSVVPSLDGVRQAVRDAVVEEERAHAIAAREAEIAARYEVVRQ